MATVYYWPTPARCYWRLQARNGLIEPCLNSPSFDDSISLGNLGQFSLDAELVLIPKDKMETIRRILAPLLISISPGAEPEKGYLGNHDDEPIKGPWVLIDGGGK
ncbi:hypothetical protein [Pseudomonas tumuqii]|uniref:hypothetical protein n=1 Tax=Pseudomonas tumuqii TaxID=2715755 RepID=UPI0015562E20|nr:hypothetical protein [Pseudomonas tumuqii]